MRTSVLGAFVAIASVTQFGLMATLLQSHNHAFWEEFGSNLLLLSFFMAPYVGALAVAHLRGLTLFTLVTMYGCALGFAGQVWFWLGLFDDAPDGQGGIAILIVHALVYFWILLSLAAAEAACDFRKSRLKARSQA